MDLKNIMIKNKDHPLEIADWINFLNATRNRMLAYNGVLAVIIT
jgi:hypothetical protein